jgi:hypothetical protein
MPQEKECKAADEARAQHLLRRRVLIQASAAGVEEKGHK